MRRVAILADIRPARKVSASNMMTALTVPMCSIGGSCKCLTVLSDSECPYWEPVKEVEDDEDNTEM